MATFSAFDPAYFLQSRESSVGREAAEFVSVRCFEDLIKSRDIFACLTAQHLFLRLRLYTASAPVSQRLERDQGTHRSREVGGRASGTSRGAAGPAIAALLGWYCPFDEGPGPSFRVILGEATWSCSACGAGGDAAALVDADEGDWLSGCHRLAR